MDIDCSNYPALVGINKVGKEILYNSMKAEDSFEEQKIQKDSYDEDKEEFNVEDVNEMKEEDNNDEDDEDGNDSINENLVILQDSGDYVASLKVDDYKY